MKKFIGVSIVVAVLATVVFGGQTALAANYTVTIQDNSGSKNQDFVFRYDNIGPGFSADAPIRIINEANSVAEVELISIEPVNQPVAPKPAPANNMLPYADLSLVRNGVVIASGTNGAYSKLIGAKVCVPALQTEDLAARFTLPAKVGNEAQNSSLWVRYSFRYTVDGCAVETPTGPTNPSTPNPPNTGDSMMPFMVIGGVSVIGLALVVFFGVTFLIPLLFRKRKDDQKTERH